MRLSVGTNFDNNLLLGIKDTNTTNVYGKLAQDIIGGGRPTISLPEITKEQVEKHVKFAHSLGIEFNYLLNSTCMDNLEFTNGVNNEIFKLVDWLKEIKIDWVTVAIPYFIDIIKKRVPEVKVSLSTFAYVDTLQKAKRFEKMGVDEITLPEGLNRNFKMLKLLRKNLKCDLQVIATNVCMATCPYRNTHMNFQSHASQENHISKGFSLDYCMLRCTEISVKNPVEIIKAPWIRPEDLQYYEEIGIDKFKITERMKKTETIINIVKSYNSRSYSGDLGRLLNFRVKADYVRPNLKMFHIEKQKGIFNLQEYRDLMFARKIQIDNRALDGFIKYFVNSNKDCRNLLCGEECTYCDKFAERAITSDKNYDNILAKRFDILFNKLSNGQFYNEEQIKIVWTEDIKELFNRMIEGKPDYIREVARISVKLRADKNAKERNSNEVNLTDLVRANYFDTPEEFRPHLIKGLKNILGIDIKDHIEERFLIEEVK